jgi:hypothetical protein
MGMRNSLGGNLVSVVLKRNIQKATGRRPMIIPVVAGVYSS